MGAALWVDHAGQDNLGARKYCLNEVRRLQLLKACIDAGHRIGKLSALGCEELIQTLLPPINNHNSVVAELLSATTQMDVARLEACLSDHISTIERVRLARDIIFPLLRAVGVLWESDRISIASEHLLSTVLRSLLGQELHTLSHSSSGPRALFATPEWERHEIGVICATLCAKSAGFRADYLGAGLPAEELVRASSTLQTSLLCISATCGTGDRLFEVVEYVASRVPENTVIWLGGAASSELARLQPSRAVVISDFCAFNEALHRLRLLCWQRE